MQTGAYFDSTGTYRYSLWRSWDVDAPQLVFVMLNPSTADAQVNDPTIRRCISYAQLWGYGRLEVVNLFALRTPQPQRLKAAVDPVGAECDWYISTAVQQADCVVIAWGNWGCLHNRDQAVLELLPSEKVYCLGWNQSGQPRHPLYLKRNSQLVPFNSKTQSRISALT